jgi:hypothetical protein
MGKTKELMMQMYERYEALEGEMNKLEQHYLNLEHQYYEQFKSPDRHFLR